MAVYLGAIKQVSKEERHENTMRRLIYGAEESIMEYKDKLRKDNLSPLYIAFIKKQIKENQAFVKKHKCK